MNENHNREHFWKRSGEETMTEDEIHHRIDQAILKGLSEGMIALKCASCDTRCPTPTDYTKLSRAWCPTCQKHVEPILTLLDHPLVAGGHMLESLIWTYGRMEDLLDKGVLHGSKVLTEEGRRQYRKLLVEGFIPNERVVRNELQKHGLEHALTLVMEFQR